MATSEQHGLPAKVAGAQGGLCSGRREPFPIDSAGPDLWAVFARPVHIRPAVTGMDSDGSTWTARVEACVESWRDPEAGGLAV